MFNNHEIWQVYSNLCKDKKNKKQKNKLPPKLIEKYMKWYWNFKRLLQGGTLVNAINSSWPSDAIRQHRSGSALFQLIVCCLMAPSHYLNHCWIITKGLLWHSSPESNFPRSADELNPQHLFGDYTFKITTSFPRGRWVKIPLISCFYMRCLCIKSRFQGQGQVIRSHRYCGM